MKLYKNHLEIIWNLFEIYLMWTQMKECLTRLVAVRHATHAAHDSEDIVVDRIDSDLGSRSAANGRVRQNKL